MRFLRFGTEIITYFESYEPYIYGPCHLHSVCIAYIIPDPVKELLNWTVHRLHRRYVLERKFDKTNLHTETMLSMALEFKIHVLILDLLEI